MKPNQMFFIVLILFTIGTTAQISKGNWMVGGSGNIYFYEGNYNIVDKKIIEKGFGIDVLPNVGYFFFNNFSAGLVSKFSYGEGKDNNNGSSGPDRNFRLGPYARYYILNKEKFTNFFIQASYNTSLFDKSFKTYQVSTKVGSAIFLTNSIGLEVSLEYSKNSIEYFNVQMSDVVQTTNVIRFGVGLQIHLEKE